MDKGIPFSSQTDSEVISQLVRKKKTKNEKKNKKFNFFFFRLVIMLEKVILL